MIDSIIILDRLESLRACENRIDGSPKVRANGTSMMVGTLALPRPVVRLDRHHLENTT